MGDGETEKPRPLFLLPPYINGGKEGKIVREDKEREIRDALLEFIERQIHRMGIKELQEAYNAVTNISDRKKPRK